MTLGFLDKRKSLYSLCSPAVDKRPWLVLLLLRYCVGDQKGHFRSIKWVNWIVIANVKGKAHYKSMSHAEWGREQIGKEFSFLTRGEILKLLFQLIDNALPLPLHIPAGVHIQDIIFLTEEREKFLNLYKSLLRCASQSYTLHPAQMMVWSRRFARDGYTESQV